MLSFKRTCLLPSCSGYKDDVELSHGDHSCGDGSHVVIAIDGVAHVEATVTDADEVDVHVVLVLLSQVLLYRVPDGRVGGAFKENFVVLATSHEISDLCGAVLHIVALFKHRDDGEAILFSNH